MMEGDSARKHGLTWQFVRPVTSTAASAGVLHQTIHSSSLISSGRRKTCWTNGSTLLFQDRIQHEAIWWTDGPVEPATFPPTRQSIPLREGRNNNINNIWNSIGRRA